MKQPGMTLAQLSSAGTSAPPAPLPPPMPQMGPPMPPPGMDEPPAMPPPPIESGPPAGIEPERPAIAPHAKQRSVGTHGSRSPNKRSNAPHGMVKGKRK